VTGTIYTSVESYLPEEKVVLSNNGQTLVFYGAIADGQARSLYSVPVSGGTPTRLTDAFNTVFIITNNNKNVLFYKSYGQTPEGVLYKLYITPIDQAAPTEINGPLVAQGSVSQFDTDSKTDRLVYRADQETDEQDELYLVDFPDANEEKLYVPMVVR
jgi:hypothetical protein